MNQLCKVCGEPAAGYHFGAFTCEGCKSFFGRTYNNPNSIGDCKNNNQCVINKKNRTSCKSCRLKKCIQVGMSKTGSRYGRRSNWFKLHCLIENPTTSLTSSTNTNGSVQLKESLNENKDLVNSIKSEANSRENHVKNQQIDSHNNQQPSHHHNHHEIPSISSKASPMSSSKSSMSPKVTMSPKAPMSPLDPSSRHLFHHSDIQLFGNGFNVLPKELSNYLLSSAYANRLLPIGSINQVSKLFSSSSVSLSPSSHHFINVKGAPPSPSDIIYGNELTDQERPIDLSMKKHNFFSSLFLN